MPRLGYFSSNVFIVLIILFTQSVNIYYVLLCTRNDSKLCILQEIHVPLSIIIQDLYEGLYLSSIEHLLLGGLCAMYIPMRCEHFCF